MRASDVHENLAHLSRELVELLGEYKALQHTIAGVIADDRLIVDTRGRKFWTSASSGTSIWLAPV